MGKSGCITCCSARSGSLVSSPGMEAQVPPPDNGLCVGVGWGGGVKSIVSN